MGIKEVQNLTMNEMKPIALSFKKNKDDFTLYKWILNHSGYSSFIKDLLREAMENEIDTINKKEEKQPTQAATSQTTSNNLIDLDF
jgi:hypothetical protein